MDRITEVEKIVHDLKVDRDTWQAVALKYKDAFEAQTTRLLELQDVCFATQAELENERAQQRRLHATSGLGENPRQDALDGAEEGQLHSAFGTAYLYSPQTINSEHQQPLFDDCTNPLFKRVHECATQRDYGTALIEVDRLLRGPLSPKVRAEGLLLKSDILRTSGPDELFDALAACAEAVELCDRLSELEDFLPRIQYQRGLLFYELRLLHQARDAFSAVGADNQFSAKASEHRKSYDDELDLLRCANRRSGFDGTRTMEGLLAQLEEKADENKRRRTTTHIKQRAAAKARRMSLPYRWMKSKSEGHQTE
ncbi:hypothetical protein BDW02DRAFT_486739 [Decorospora gaudefroyi]|uniref:Uncharacterized protein n=1 Tax=Decorospora gaudefroyi TaxID=184978 RepID=A0A6A5KT95_9PLEO|nr:hypothetical protein BDW02DRAFT_486739 [Decorospora gaudefroyi]